MFLLTEEFKNDTVRGRRLPRLALLCETCRQEGIHVRVAARKNNADTAEIIIRANRNSFSDQISEFLRYRELLYFLVWKNLKVRYAQAVLGAAWSVLQPLLTALIMGVLLGRFARIPTDGVPPFLFYFSALVPWTFFANAVTTTASSLVSNQQLIKKVYFARLCLPIASVLSAMVDLLVPLILLLATMLVYGGHLPPLEIVIALPVLLLIAATAATGLGVGLSALNLQYRDIQVALPFVIQLLFFASPIVYSVSHVPERFRFLYFINPMASVIDGFRALVLQTHSFSWSATLIGAAASFILLVIGVAYFERTEIRFADVA